MSETNPLWGAPRIHGELTKLGIEISQATISRYMVRHRMPPSQKWRTALKNHAKEIVSIDFLTVPTGTCRVLSVFLILSNHRRQIIHFNVSTNPSAAWTSQQIVEASPWDTAPRYLIRDRDGIYGNDFVRRVEGMGVEDVPIAARSPWQNPYVERVIGSIRRECLDHVIVFSERHLQRMLRGYLEYYHGSRTHLGLEKDCPIPRRIEPPNLGAVLMSRWSAGCISGTSVERRDRSRQPIHLMPTIAMRHLPADQNRRWPSERPSTIIKCA